MTIVLYASLDPSKKCVNVNSSGVVSSVNTQNAARGIIIKYALSIIQAYIFMIVFNTPPNGGDGSTSGPSSSKKGSRSRTVIGISQTPALSSSEFNENMSMKDKANGARWMLVAICGPFSNMTMAMNVVSECKFETKGTRSKVTKLIRLADGIRRTTTTKPTVYLNTGIKKLPPTLLV